MRRILLSVSIAWTWSASAQLFSIPDTSITLTKSISFGTIHGYAEIENLTSGPLGMVWTSHFSADLPSQWNISFDDQETYLDTLVPGDTALITLDSAATLPKKMIIGIAHNQVVGSGVVTITAWPTADPTDSAHILYVITVTPDSASGSMTPSSKRVVSLWGNMLHISTASIPNEVVVCHTLGMAVIRHRPQTNHMLYDLTGLPPGLYVVELRYAQGPSVWTRVLR